MQYYFRRRRVVPWYLKALAALVTGLVVLWWCSVMTQIAGADPVYTNRTNNITLDNTPYATEMWDDADPFGFSAVEYALYWSDMFNTNGVRISSLSTTLTNYVTQSQYIQGTNSLSLLISGNTSDISGLRSQISSNDTDITALQASLSSARIDITNNNYIANLALTNPPSFTGVITNLSDVIYVWQENTNIVLDARGYRWLRNSSVVTGYTCTAQSGIDPDLVGTVYYLVTTPTTTYTYTEQNGGFDSTLSFSELGGDWVFLYTDGPYILFDTGTAAQDTVALTSGARTVTFERGTNLTYVTYTYIENFALSNELAAVSASLQSGLDAAAAAATNYTGAAVAAASATLQPQITSNDTDIASLRADVDNIVTTNLSALVESYFATNRTTRLWSAPDGVSNRFVTVEGDWLVHYLVSSQTVWYVTASGTSLPSNYENGTFRVTGTPDWPEPLNGVPDTSVAYATSSSKWRLYCSVNGDGSVTNTYVAGSPFTATYYWTSADGDYQPSAQSWRYAPASVSYTSLSGHAGSVSSGWTIELQTNEISRAYIGPLPSGAVPLYGVEDGEGEYTIYGFGP